MFPDAIHALFANLNAIPEFRCSPYDKALHYELQIILSAAENANPSASWNISMPKTLRQSVGAAVACAIGRAGRFNVWTLPRLRDLTIDLGSSATVAADRWTQCPQPDCPQKELW